MGFRFRFERLLRYRGQLEKESLRRMADLRRRRESILQDLRQLRGRLQQVEALWRDLEGGEVRVEDLRRLQWAMTYLRGEMRVLKQGLAECESHLQEARSIWLQRRRDRRMLELLKERRREEFLRSLIRAETKYLDEMALRPFVAPTPVGRDSTA